MSKLHEILAVETSLGETANQVIKNTSKTLGEKRSIFTGMTKKHEIFAEDKQHLVQATENVEIQSTVAEQLDFLGKEVSRYWDVLLQKEEANQRAVADIIVDGKTIASGIPSIVLLGMEKRLTSLLSTYNAIPTLDAAKAWEEDPSAEKAGVYRTKHVSETQQAVNKKEYVTVTEATAHHPAQVAEQTKTEVVGKYIRTDFSSSITSYDKAGKLGRLTSLIRAVKQARMRANATEVKSELQFGNALFDYING